MISIPKHIIIEILFGTALDVFLPYVYGIAKNDRNLISKLELC